MRDCPGFAYRDIASMDEQGFCRIVGRSKDMIIRGGENIYPAELEDFFHTHPQVQEVQVRRRAPEVGTCVWCVCVRVHAHMQMGVPDRGV